MNCIQRNCRRNYFMLKHCIRQISSQHNKDVILCPGQASQYVGMLQNYKGNDATRRIIDCANDILGYGLLKLCKDGPKEMLDRYDVNKGYNNCLWYLRRSVVCQ